MIHTVLEPFQVDLAIGEKRLAGYLPLQPIAQPWHFQAACRKMGDCSNEKPTQNSPVPFWIGLNSVKN